MSSLRTPSQTAPAAGRPTPRKAGAFLAVAAAVACAGIGLTAAHSNQAAVRSLVSAKLSGDAAPRLDATSPERFVLQLRQPLSELSARRLTGTGARLARSYQNLPMAVVAADGKTLQRLAMLPDVTHVSRDLGVRRTMEFAAPAVGAPTAWNSYGLSGKGVNVAVIDSGVQNTADIRRDDLLRTSRIVGGYDFVTNGLLGLGLLAATSNNDPCGHGTEVAGIIAGNGADSSYYVNSRNYCYRRFVGIAPEAGIVNLRVLEEDGSGSVGDVIAALDWCISNRTRLNIRVANLSLGHAPTESYTTDPLCQAAERAWKAGILVVCAAGNRGRLEPDNPYGGSLYGTVNSPGNSPYVLTVGASNDMATANRGDDMVTSYSSRGPTLFDSVVKPDLVAPGNQIISMRNSASLLSSVLARKNVIDPSYYWVGKPTASGGYFVMSGTSMAAGVVSGAAALLFQKDATLTPNDVKARLMMTAVKSWRTDGATADLLSRGAGLLDIPAALNSTFVASEYTLSPFIRFNEDGVAMISKTQGGTPIYGDQALWGGEPKKSYQNNTSVESGPASSNNVYSDQALWGGEPKKSVSSGSMVEPTRADLSSIALNGD